MPEFDVRLERVLYANVTIVASDASDALDIVALSPDYDMPPMSAWTVASGGEITVTDEDGDVLAEGSWSIGRVIPEDEAGHYHDSQPDTPCRCATPGTYAPQGTPAVLEVAAGEFRIMLFSMCTVVSLPATPAYQIEASGEIIIPATDPSLQSDLPLMVRARDGSEYPAHVEPSALEDKTRIVLQ
jgi:hypothetical protein